MTGYSYAAVMAFWTFVRWYIFAIVAAYLLFGLYLWLRKDKQ